MRGKKGMTGGKRVEREEEKNVCPNVDPCLANWLLNLDFYYYLLLSFYSLLFVPTESKIRTHYSKNINITIVQPLHSLQLYWRPALSIPSRSKQGGKWAAWPTARDSSEPGTRRRSRTRRGPSGRGHPDSSCPTGSGWTLIRNKAKLMVWMRPECLVHTLENVLLVHDNVKCIYVPINVFDWRLSSLNLGNSPHR